MVATLAFGWAFCVHSGTGAIFGFGARVLYESPLLPAAFVAAAMASGTALMIVMIVGLFKATKRHVDDELIVWLGRFLAICLLVVVYFLFVENAYRVYVVELRHAGHVLSVRRFSQRAVLGRTDTAWLCGSHVDPVSSQDRASRFPGLSLRPVW